MVQICYALRRTDRHRAVQTQSTVRSAKLCIALPDFPPNWRSRKLYFALVCSALLCQAPRCASAVCIMLRHSLRRSARLRAVKRILNRAMLFSASFCQTPRCASLSTVRSAMLCSASLCQTPCCASAVDNALVRSAMLCSASTCQTACYSGEVGRVLCYALRSFVRLRAALAQSTNNMLDML